MSLQCLSKKLPHLPLQSKEQDIWFLKTPNIHLPLLFQNHLLVSLKMEEI